MLWYRHRQVPGRQDTMLVADSGGAHVSKEPDVAKMEPSAADMALTVWNGYVWDARRHIKNVLSIGVLCTLAMHSTQFDLLHHGMMTSAFCMA